MSHVFFTSVKQALLRAAAKCGVEGDPQEYGHLMLLTEQLQKLIDQPAPTICIVVDGGVVQSVICDQDIRGRVYKVEYTDGQESEDDESVYQMPQTNDGKWVGFEPAWVGRFDVEVQPHTIGAWMPYLEASDEN